MAQGVTALERTLIGVEASAGSSTDAPTTYWRGMGKVKNRRETVFPPERVGKVGGTTRSYVPKTGGEPTLEGDAIFEQLPYIFNAGIYAVAATTDTGSGYIRSWSVQHSSTDLFATTDLNTLVIESGDNNNLKVARYCFIREYTITGKQGEALQISAVLDSRAPSTSAGFTTVGDTDLENPAEAILFSMVTFAIDDSTGTAGATPYTETILEMSLRHKTGWVPLPARDGRLDFSSIKHIDDEIMLDLTMEHNANAETEYSKWESQSERVIRLQFAGTSLTSAGTYSTKVQRFDLYGKWSAFAADGLGEQDGDNIVRATFRCAYSPGAIKKFDIVNVTEVVTLP